jgi:16S rRNA G966 N2-methylase RsmD
MIQTFLKLTFIPGLKEVVLDETKQYPELTIVKSTDNAIYLGFIQNTRNLLNLRSVMNVYLVKQDPKYNPLYVSNHKSILGELIETVLNTSNDIFTTFKLSCAGSDTKEIQTIKKFITETYTVTHAEDADLEIYMGKIGTIWEIGVRLTGRPLSLRDYKIANIKGGLNPTIAYAMNTFCNLNSQHSYLNIFCGSATLLIEAANINPNLHLVGFDNNGKTIAEAIKNIKKAGKLKDITLTTVDIFEEPNLGTFDIITSDLPFGMQIAKGEDLHKLYACFLDYSERSLNSNGILVAYTSEHALLHKLILQSKFSIIEILDLTIPTASGAYLHPKIFVCKAKVTEN